MVTCLTLFSLLAHLILPDKGHCNQWVEGRLSQALVSKVGEVGVANLWKFEFERKVGLNTPSRQSGSISVWNRAHRWLGLTKPVKMREKNISQTLGGCKPLPRQTEQWSRLENSLDMRRSIGSGLPSPPSWWPLYHHWTAGLGQESQVNRHFPFMGKVVFNFFSSSKTLWYTYILVQKLFI